MYTALLVIHSLLRWLVVIAGLLACVRSLSGWLGKRDWSPADARYGLIFMIAVDVQFLVGLVLYVFVSPITHAAFQNFGAAMHVNVLRFFAVEHTPFAVIALATVHIARVRARKVDGVARHRVAAIGFVFAMLIILAAIPWPFLPYGRPLLRL